MLQLIHSALGDGLNNRARILEKLKRDGVGGIPELSIKLELPRTTVRYHLLMLVAEGKVRRVKLSERVVLWEAGKELKEP